MAALLYRDAGWAGLAGVGTELSAGEEREDTARSVRLSEKLGL